MAGLLDGDPGTDDTFQGVPPDVAQALAMLSTAGIATTGGDGDAGLPATPAASDASAPASSGAGAAAPADAGPPFWDRLSRGIGKAGMVLAGGDPGLYDLSPEQQRVAGTRALLNMSLSMLANSGPSYTRRNFGQILAAGLESASQTPVTYEQMLANRAAQTTELGLKRAALGIQAMSAQKQLEQLKLLLGRIQAGQGAVTRALGGGGSAPSLSSPAAAGQAEGDFVTKFQPIADTVSAATGLPSDYITAQAAHETDFGRSPAAAGNNFFGIMDPATGKPARYASVEEGVKAYTDLMGNERYRGVTRSGSPASIGDAMAVAGYNPNVPSAAGEPPPAGGSYGARIGGIADRIAKLRGGGTQTASGGAATPSAPPGVQIGGEPPPPPGGVPGVAPPPAISLGRALGGGAPTATAPGGGKTSALDAILQGVQLAQTTPSGGVLAAGPAAPTAIAPPAAAPGPAWSPTGGGGASRYSDSPTVMAPVAPAPGPAPGTLPDSGSAAPAAAPDTPEIAAARVKLGQARDAQRQQVQATRTAKLQALQGELSPDTGAKVSAIEQEQQAGLAKADQDYQAGQIALDKEAREQQDKISAEQRAEQRTAREADAKFQRDQQAAATQQQYKLAGDIQAAKVSNNQERLKTYNAAATQSQSLKNAIDQIELILPSVGPADVVAQMDPRVRDTLRSLDIGSDADYQKWTAQDVLSQLANRAALSAKPTGISRMSNLDVGLITGAMPRLGQSPQAREIGLAMMKTQAQIAIDEARAANKSFNTNPAGATLDDDVSNATGTASRIPSPPKLVAPDAMRRTAPQPEIDAAKATDGKNLEDYLTNIQPGTVFRTYGTQTVNGKPQRVLTWGYKRPDGSLVINPLGSR
jgi:hypothetical protein